MYSYSIYSTKLSIIVLPSCCNKFSRHFLFNPKDSFYAAKKNLLFSCPFCKTTYPDVNKVLNTLSILNIIVGTRNQYIHSKKKKGFIISLATSGQIYNYIDKLISFDKVFKNISIENVKEEDYEEYFYNLISFASDNQDVLPIDKNKLLLNGVSIKCKKCAASFDLNNKIETKKNIICEKCNNYVGVPNKYLKEILLAYANFQNMIREMINTKIFVIPFSLYGMYMSYANGDNELFEILNK